MSILQNFASGYQEYPTNHLFLRKFYRLVRDKRLTQKQQQGSNSSECWPCFVLTDDVVLKADEQTTPVAICDRFMFFIFCESNAFSKIRKFVDSW